MWNGINRRKFPRANYSCVIRIKKRVTMMRAIPLSLGAPTAIPAFHPTKRLNPVLAASAPPAWRSS